MRVHHLNCGTLCPVSARLSSGAGGWLERGHYVCHCLLVELPDRLVLVDTGLGLRDLDDVRRRLGGMFLALLHPALDPNETAARQVEALGFRREDVRDVLVTHLDPDHAGGLSDFPHARVHLTRQEWRASFGPTWVERQRYRRIQWDHEPEVRAYGPSEGTWRGFEAVRDLDGLPPEILLVPLPGHTRGHAGVAVETPSGPVLHCGDAYFHRLEMTDPARCPRGVSLLHRVDDFDRAARIANQVRLRSLHARGEVAMFCAHDPYELTHMRAEAGAPPARGASRDAETETR